MHYLFCNTHNVFYVIQSNEWKIKAAATARKDGTGLQEENGMHLTNTIYIHRLCTKAMV